MKHCYNVHEDHWKNHCELSKIALIRAGSSLFCPLTTCTEGASGYTIERRNVVTTCAEGASDYTNKKHYVVIKQLLRAMKLTGVLILVAVLSVSANGIGQNVSLSVKNASLKKVFDEIIMQSGTSIIYNNVSLKSAKPVTVDVKNATVDQVLDLCLKGQPFSYTVEEGLIYIKATPTPDLSQGLRKKDFSPSLSPSLTTPPVTGIVRGPDGQPLAGVNIIIKGSKKGTTTDNAGAFSINAKEGDRLVISSVGYASTEIPVDNNNNIPAIVLQKSESKLDEVQIIAYGQTTKRINTGDVTTVKAAEIEQQPVTNPILALQGRVAGMEITQSNGLPGSSIKVLIRGRNTIEQGTDPLYIIDGVPYSPNPFGGRYINGLGGIQGINPLSFLNPQDIESIDVLKDADATAIYGSRGANGVVLITTKKGKAGKSQLNANIQSGIGKISRKAKLMNTRQYLEMRKEAFANDGITPDELSAKDLTVWDQNAYTDWQKAMIGGTARYHDIQLTLSGGNVNTQYSIGSNYHKETTVFPGTWSDQKSSVHFNISTSSLNQKFKAMLSGNYVSDNNQLPNKDFTANITLAPNAPNPILPDGSLDWTNYSNNPLVAIKQKYLAKADNLISNAVLSYTIIQGLEIKSSFGYNTVQINENFQSPTSAISPFNPFTKGGISNFNGNITKSWIVEPQVTYKRSIGRGKFDALFGATIQKNSAEGQIFGGREYTSDELLGSLAAAGIVDRGPVVSIRYKYNSGFARLGYNLYDKYLINLTARRDGSSRFGRGKQFGNFGSIGAGWIFSNESFIKDKLPAISYGKLRGSYGTSGNEPGDNYQYFELYNFQSGIPYSGGSGIYPINFSAPDFSWEVNRKLEAGLELGFAKDRAIISVSYYRNRSPNQLVYYITPQFTGFGGVMANLPAIVQNRGWEITLNTINITDRNFSWKSSFNFTAAQNKLIAFPNLETSAYGFRLAIGQPITVNKVYSFAGVDPQTGIYNFYDKDGQLTFDPAPGRDNTKFANLTPKYYGGFQNNFKFKNLQLDLNIQYVKQTGNNYLFALGAPGYAVDGGGNQAVDVLNRWQKAGDIKSFQKYSTQYSSAYFDYAINSDAIFSNASFIRFKTIALSYNFSSKFLRKIHVGNLNIYLHAQNLFTISGYKGVDPENQSLQSLPPLRTITAGIQFTL
jgi:TonB-dependent starch-binding outer membrane protein SusC